MKIRCNRCGKIFSGKNEYDAELLFNDHKCANKRDLAKMDLDLLKKVCIREISETEAWKMQDERKLCA